MLKIVSNTTPLISLLKIDKLQVLKDLYGEIVIPQEVFNEIEAGKNKEFHTDLSKIEWIKINKIQNQKSLSSELLTRNLTINSFSRLVRKLKCVKFRIYPVR